MTYSEYSIVKDGRHGYSITLPCFSDDEDFSAAKLMNKFYESIMEQMYLFAEDFTGTTERRAFFKCGFEINSDEEITAVTLAVALRRGDGQKLSSKVTHCWKNGRIIKKILFH